MNLFKVPVVGSSPAVACTYGINVNLFKVPVRGGGSLTVKSTCGINVDIFKVPGWCLIDCVAITCIRRTQPEPV